MRCASDVGTHGELLSCAWLIGQGFDVFRNVSPAGPADIVVRDRDTGETVAVDVKTLNKPIYNKDGSLRYFADKPKHDVHFLMVVQGQVLGFFRNTGNRSTEPYWPFSRPPKERTK